MKLPAIVQQPVGEFASGNIPQPSYKALGDAQMNALSSSGQAIATVLATSEVATTDEATANAAKELSELRAKLENNNVLPYSEVPDDMLAEMQLSVSDGEGGRREVSKPKVFTHDVAEGMWDRGTDEIIGHYASTINDKKARDKFIKEMTERYVAPGTLAVSRINAARTKAHGQANAEVAIQAIAATIAPSEVKEQQMQEIITRQLLLGADAEWARLQLAGMGPMIDQIAIQNDVLGANTVDQLDQIEETMWGGGTRLDAPAMRTQSEQITKKRNALKAQKREQQDANALDMLAALADPNTPFGMDDVVNAAKTDQIDDVQAWTFYNALQSGTTTRASDPFTLSKYRGAINTMQYTGANARVSDRAKLLRASIVSAQYGLNPDASVNPIGASISGQDAFQLMKDIDSAEKAALENNAYDDALKDAMAWTRVKVDLNGQIIQGIAGSQHTVDAAIAMKGALDSYMNQFGADADPVAWVQENKDAYNPNNFRAGIDGRFLQEVPEVTPYMTIDQDGKVTGFSQPQQDEFVDWFNGQVNTMPAAEGERIWTLFKQYYRFEGVPPGDGRLLLESDDPLYRQFEALMMPDVDME